MEVNIAKAIKVFATKIYRLRFDFKILPNPAPTIDSFR